MAGLDHQLISLDEDAQEPNAFRPPRKPSAVKPVWIISIPTAILCKNTAVFIPIAVGTGYLHCTTPPDDEEKEDGSENPSIIFWQRMKTWGFERGVQLAAQSPTHSLLPNKFFSRCLLLSTSRGFDRWLRRSDEAF
uniref:Uncharacterized protein n=1 Tax=Salix viminalis TaxID=40686 RepID=A0A6N2MC82_SALVM